MHLISVRRTCTSQSIVSEITDSDSVTATIISQNIEITKVNSSTDVKAATSSDSKHKETIPKETLGYMEQ